MPELVTPLPEDARDRPRAAGRRPRRVRRRARGRRQRRDGALGGGNRHPGRARRARADPRSCRAAAAARAARADAARHARCRWGCWWRSAAAARRTRCCSCSRTARTPPRTSNERIDNVVRGLISIGVRQGEHVGVLMSTRPSALALVVALSRLGAVSVLLRPDGDVAREARLGQVERVIADPEHAPVAAEIENVASYVLGGGGGPRDLGLPLTADLEQIDPRPSICRGGIARIRAAPARWPSSSFTGEGERTRMSRITNRRWALSAFGTASSAALSEDGHRLQRHAAVPPLRADDEHRRRDRRRRAAGDGAPVRPLDVLGGGPALRGDGRLVHVDAARTTSSRRRRSRASAITPSGCSSAPACRAGCGGGSRSGSRRRGCSSSTPRPRPPRSWSTSATSNAVRWAGRCRAAPRSRSPATTSRPAGCVLGRDGFARECAVDEVGMLMARVKPDRSTDGRAAAGRVHAGGRVARHRRSVQARHRWRLLAGRQRSRGDPHRRRPGVQRPDPRRARGLPAVDLAVAYGVGTEDGRAAARSRGGDAAPGTPADRARHRARARRTRARPAPDDRAGGRADPGHDLVPADHRAASGRRRARPSRGTLAWYRDPGRDTYRKLTPEAYEQLVGVEPARPAS